jgi:cytochrome c oxidase accessory protein FixG
MMDNDTLTVAYRHWRGEPRGKHRKAEGAYKLGDCIDCMACVNVCPAGIDIRDGQQMECITCALCIDACDEVMEKIGKPRGLIDYLALADEERETAGTPPRPIWQHVLRPRTILYTAMWSLIGVALVYALFVRSDIDLTVEPIRNPQFVTLSDGSVRNTYTLRIRNLTADDRDFRIMLTSDEILRIEVETTGPVPNHVTVPANETMQARVYVIARPQDAAADEETTDLRLWVEDTETDDRAGVATIFNGKG